MLNTASVRKRMELHDDEVPSITVSLLPLFMCFVLQVASSLPDKETVLGQDYQLKNRE